MAELIKTATLPKLIAQAEAATQERALALELRIAYLHLEVALREILLQQQRLCLA